jgi:hypothetical protein
MHDFYRYWAVNISLTYKAILFTLSYGLDRGPELIEMVAEVKVFNF